MNLLETLSIIMFPKLSAESYSLFSYFDSEELLAYKERTKNPKSIALNKLYIAFPYSPVSDLLDRVKLGSEFEIAYDLGQLFATRVWDNSEIFLPSPDCIVPVPADRKRKNKRGFAVSEILANCVYQHVKRDNEELIHLPLLVKTYSTVPQSTLTKKARTKNIQNVYSLDSTKLTMMGSRHIIWLIDDIVATQSTIGECARIIKKHLPEVQIYGIVLCGN